MPYLPCECARTVDTKLVTGSYNSSYVHVYELNTLTINLKRLHREVAAEVELPLDL